MHVRCRFRIAEHAGTLQMRNAGSHVVLRKNTYDGTTLEGRRVMLGLCIFTAILEIQL